MINSNDTLSALNREVISAVVASGLRIEKRRFIPHITLGRYRHSKNVFSGAIPMNVSLETTLNEVVLYESVLTPVGAEYEPIYRFPLDQVDQEFVDGGFYEG